MSLSFNIFISHLSGPKKSDPQTINMSATQTINMPALWQWALSRVWPRKRVRSWNLAGLLVHAACQVAITLTTDVSDVAVGAVVEQRVMGAWQSPV